MGQFSTHDGPMVKPARLARDVAAYQRRTARTKAKRAETRKAQKAWSELSAKVCKRDGNTCRICGCQTTKFGVGNPRFWGCAHHVIFRSAGGPDLLVNLIWCCNRCHQETHSFSIDVSGTADNLKITHRETAVGVLENTR